MSTKRLSRTVLEGGRTRYEKRMRHLEQKAERARMRNYLANVKRDLEYADEYNCPIRRRIFEGFTDKLKPVYRYIDSKVGQRWDDVWSELSERFDLRSLSGYHICYQHVVPEVFPDPLRFFWHKPKWYVEDGILLANKYSKPSPEDIKEKTEELKTVVEWLEGHGQTVGGWRDGARVRCRRSLFAAFIARARPGCRCHRDTVRP